MKPFFWMKPASGAVVKPLTPEAVEEAEAKLNVKLPALLIALLMEQNGGRVRYDAFPLPEEILGKDECLTFDELMGIDHSPDYWKTIIYTPRKLEVGRLPQDIVLIISGADGSGHGWIALDYRLSGRNGEPSVVWVDEEIDVDEQIAPNFQSFIDQLVISAPEHVYGFSRVGQPLDRLLEELSQALHTTFSRTEYERLGHWYADTTRTYELYESTMSERWQPLFPECEYFLTCDITAAERPAVEAALRNLTSCEVQLVHVPTCIEE